MKHWKLFSLLLAVLLALSACGTQDPPSATEPQEPDTWLMNFPGAQWGMDPEELCTALGISEDDCEGGPSGTQYILHGVRSTLFGVENAYLGFFFDDQNGDGTFTLYSVQAYLPADTDMEAVKGAMSEAYGAPAQDGQTNATWNSQALCQDIMTQAEADYLNSLNDMARRTLTTPVTTLTWSTDAYQPFTLDGVSTRNLLIFNSSAAFYTHEGGFTAQIG